MAFILFCTWERRSFVGCFAALVRIQFNFWISLLKYKRIATITLLAYICFSQFLVFLCVDKQKTVLFYNLFSLQSLERFRPRWVLQLLNLLIQVIPSWCEFITMFPTSFNWITRNITAIFLSFLVIIHEHWLISFLTLQIIPILRAGLALAEHASTILPATRTYHLGKKRW